MASPSVMGGLQLLRIRGTEEAWSDSQWVSCWSCISVLPVLSAMMSNDYMPCFAGGACSPSWRGRT